MKRFRKIKKSITALIVMMCCSGYAWSQQGQTDFGLRLGTDPGITVKYFLRPAGAVEGILHTGYRGLLITGLYEWHKGIGTSDAPGLKLYGGVGGHYGIFRSYHYYYKGPHSDVVYVYNRPSLGVDGIIGLEYDFTGVPLNLSLDMKPAVDFYSGYGYTYLDGALSVRVIF